MGVVSHLLSLQGVVKSPNVQQTNLKKNNNIPNLIPSLILFFSSKVTDLHPIVLPLPTSALHLLQPR